MKVLSFFSTRPVGVSMSFLALILLGIVASFRIPIALLPNIPAGKVIVKTFAEGYSSRKLEDEIAQHIRLKLMQISKVEDIKSKTYEGLNIIELSFPFGTDMEMAVIEINEQIDRIMSDLPRSIARPIVMRIAASDIPVFYLNISSKSVNKKTSSELSKFAVDIVRRRLEQLSSVAFVDISGLVEDEIVIIPDKDKLKILGIDIEDIHNTIKGSIFKNTSINLVRNEFEYKLVFPAIIKNTDDIRNLIVKKENRDIFLSEICNIEKKQKRVEGYCLLNGDIAISMAIIRQEGSRLKDLKDDIDKVITEIKEKNPQIEFEFINDQSKLLDVTISNLLITLIVGTILAIIVVILFIGNSRLSLIIGLSIPISLLISILFFYIIHLSINIISLSGLILGIGMMIDNAIIVVDNISRKYSESNNLSIALVEGPSEVFSPLLSSVLTTTCIFIPLIFLSGISGALFYDQAIAVAVGLFVSLAVSMILVPVYYKLIKPNSEKGTTRISILFEKFYEFGFYIANKYQKILALLCIGIIVISLLSVYYIKKEKIPTITRLNSMIYIDWNQPISTTENHYRISELCQFIKKYTVQQMAWVGRQQYYLQHIKEQNARESRCFFAFNSRNDRDKTLLLINEWIANNYPETVMDNEIVPNLFDYIFLDDEPELALRLYYDKPELATPSNFFSTFSILDEFSSLSKMKTLPMQEQFGFVLDQLKLSLINVDPEVVLNELYNQLQTTKVASIPDGAEIRDIVLLNNQVKSNNWANELFIYDNNRNAIPLNKLGKKTSDIDWSIIYSDQEGEYIPAEFMQIDNPSIIIDKINETVKKIEGWNLGVGGTFIRKNELFREMIIVMLVSLILLYFILAAQFESLSQPLIILLEIPIDIAGVTFMLYIFNSSLNIISMIGIIVMSGIVINDSILKIDTINRLIKKGLSVQDAIHKAGQIRLRPILMTSFTTILALIPFIFGKGIGNEIQKPLALSIIGGLGLGTIVSLLFIPFFYKWLHNLTLALSNLFTKKR